MIAPEKIAESFREQGFVATGEVATTLFLEGPPGVGKTEIAKLWGVAALTRRL